ncbi:MAG: hypothetical protein ACYC7E_12210 [Armatimonadota bacterium]
MKTGLVLALLTALVVLGFSLPAGANCGGSPSAAAATTAAVEHQELAAAATTTAANEQPQEVTTPTPMGCGMPVAGQPGTPGSCSTGFCAPQENVAVVPGPDVIATATGEQTPDVTAPTGMGCGSCGTGFCAPQDTVAAMPVPDDYGVMPFSEPMAETGMPGYDYYAYGVPPLSEPMVETTTLAPTTCGIAPFSPPMQYMSQAGYLRWQQYQMTGQWQTPQQAYALASTERMLCAMR